MSASDPPDPPPSRGLRRLRPWYLVATMVLTWLVGLNGIATGCSTLFFLREGNVADVSALAKEARDARDPMQFVAVAQAARLRAMSEAHPITFPLSAGKLVLSALLLVASGLAWAGRPGARSLALQALIANGLLAGLDYFLTRGVRAQWIEAVAVAGEALPKAMQEHVLVTYRPFYWWVERARFALFDIGVLAVAVWALTREQTRKYFEAVAQASDAAEEP